MRLGSASAGRRLIDNRYGRIGTCRFSGRQASCVEARCERAEEGQDKGAPEVCRSHAHDDREDTMLLRRRNGSPSPAPSPSDEIERLRADAVLASAANAFSCAAAPHAFGVDPRLRAADLRAQARRLETSLSR